MCLRRFNQFLQQTAVPPTYEPGGKSFELFLDRLSLYFEVTKVPDKDKVSQLCLFLGV